MLKPKIIIPSLICLFLLFFMTAPTVFAQGALLQGTSLGEKCNPGNAAGFIPCLKEVYKYGVGVVIILAVIVMMWGGLVWLTSGGNVSRIENAKSWISGSVLGLILALTSFILLNTINPQLTVLNINVPGINKAVGVCINSETKCSSDKNCTPPDKGSCVLSKTEDICCQDIINGKIISGSPLIFGMDCENLPISSKKVSCEISSCTVTYDGQCPNFDYRISEIPQIECRRNFPMMTVDAIRAQFQLQSDMRCCCK